MVIWISGVENRFNPSGCGIAENSDLQTRVKVTAGETCCLFPLAIHMALLLHLEALSGL